jgi:predicted ATPase/DNA-binding SARP family transcriptional activator
MKVSLLGPLEVRDGADTPVEVGGRRVRMLLTLLAVRAGQPVSNEYLIDRIWDGHPPEGAANALQALVSRLRRSLPEGAVESHPSGYRLAVDPDAVDVHRFERLATAGAAAGEPGRAAATLGRALDLWRGPIPTEAGFSPAEVARLEELRRSAIEDRAEAQLRLGNGANPVPDLQALVAAHPTRERAVGLLMRALAKTGRTAEALAAYERTRTALAERLGADPCPELAALHLRLLRGEPGRERTNLRAELTSFVGRDEDLTRVGKLVGEHRLVTLTGPGGSGKTRLAVESARTLLDQSPDGVWLVELAPVTDPAELPHAVLATLGLRDHLGLPTSRGLVQAPEPAPAEAVDRLAGALAGKAMLLVLDNCEHLVAAVAGLAARLLGTCPDLRILATSREPLGITGEALWPVEPLPLPPPDVQPADAMGYAAVRLLADRAAAVRPGFAVADPTVGDVIRICRALDGMPLAIELAAARLRTLTPAQLASRLGDRFRFLTGGSRTALPRHQTLRAVVDWSWELLDPAEQALLRRLASFTGGATLAAAERVCGGDEVPTGQVLDLLTALVDKSLLVPDSSGADQPRYRMLETIRAYGSDRLADAGETDVIRRAHAAYFVWLAETAEPWLRTGEQRRWLDRLGAEHENLQAALRSAIAAGEAETAVRLVAALGWYWSLAGHRRETIPLAVQALQLPGEVPDGTRALAYTMIGCAAADLVPEAQMLDWFQTAARLAGPTDHRHPMLRMVGPIVTLFDAWRWDSEQSPGPVLDPLLDDPDPWVRAMARTMRLHVSVNAGGYQPELADELRVALDDYRRSGDRWGVAFALANAAELATLAGDLTTATAHAEEAVALLSQLGIPEDKVLFQVRLVELRWVRGDRAGALAELAAARIGADRVGLAGLQAMVWRTAGDLARLAGDLATARSELDRAWTIAAGRVPTPELRAGIATSRGHLAIAEGDLAAARAHHRTALEMSLDAGCAPAIARALIGFADLALSCGHAGRAAELLGTADAVRSGPDRSVPDAQRMEAAARAAAGDAGFTEAYRRGRMSVPTGETVRALVLDQVTA